MSLREGLQFLSDGGYLALFALSLSYALRSRSQLGVDIALFFGAIAAVVILALLPGSDAEALPEHILALQGLLIMALPYLLLRLLHDLDGVAALLRRSSAAGLLLAGALLFGYAPVYPDAVVLLLVAYFVALQSYVSVRFLQAARSSRGLTRRRLYMVATGSGLVATIILLAGVQALLPAAAGVLQATTTALGLASAVSYYIGFATPRLLKRAWRANHLRQFIEMSSGAAGVEQLLSQNELQTALEQRVASMIGADRAVIIHSDVRSGQLMIAGEPIRVRSQRPDRLFAYRVFTEQRPRFTANAMRDDAENADLYRDLEARAIFAAPITFRERRLGVLVAFAARPSLFAQDDLELVQILASQIAAFLVFRELLGRATALQAQEQANALREEFLAAAAHDLKTPLTVVLGEVQLMQRDARRDPALAAWVERLDHVNDMSLRMRRLIDDLLDASRAEQGGFVREREPVDLGRLARETAARFFEPRHEIAVDASSVIVAGDRERLRQVIANLLENAVKYSPAGGVIEVRVRARDSYGLLTVADRGIGVPEADQATVFERFRRGANVEGVRSGGIGIGLYLCRRIVDEHGGTIALHSRDGGGTTFTVSLPLESAVPDPETVAPQAVEGTIAHAGTSAGGG